MDFDKMIDEEIKRNPELAKVFEEHPERKEMYKHKLRDTWDAPLGCTQPNPVWCRTCLFSHGEPPFEDLPEKAYCKIYSKDEGEGKPPEVYFDGEECEFYEKE